MKLFNLSVNQLNQNGYSKNMQTKGKIGALFAFPINHTPDDCLSCDGYSLLIVDYKDLYNLLGKSFNQLNDPDDTFRIPDYNVSKRFLQPGSEVGTLINAGLPNIIGDFTCRSSHSSGCFRSTYHSVGQAYWNNVNNDSFYLKTLNASLSNEIYGSSNTVQPPSQTVHICIKYK